MPAPTPEQIAKLPKWAQRHIQHLDELIARCNTLLAQAATNHGDTDVFVETLYGEPDFGLPRHTRVKFRVNEHDVVCSINSDGRWLDVYSTEALSVQPFSSNVIRVRPERWWEPKR